MFGQYFAGERPDDQRVQMTPINLASKVLKLFDTRTINSGLHVKLRQPLKHTSSNKDCKVKTQRRRTRIKLSFKT